MGSKEILNSYTGFEWDDGNFDKNIIRHGVSVMEAEEVFPNHPLITGTDSKHSRREERYYCLGHTDEGKLLFAAFVVRGRNIRDISAREMTVKEERMYLSL